MSFNIIGCSSKQFNVVFGKTEHHIAVLTQEFAHGSSEMTMINCQRTGCFFMACACSLWFTTQDAHAILTRKHFIILCDSQAELLAEFVHSPLFGVPYALILRWWMRFSELFPVCHLANLARVSDTKPIPGSTIRGEFRKQFCFMTASALFCLVWRRYLLFVPSVLQEAYLTSGLLVVGVCSVSAKISERFRFEAGVTLFLGYTVHDKGHSLSGSGCYQHRGASSCLPLHYTINPPEKQVYGLLAPELVV